MKIISFLALFLSLVAGCSTIPTGDSYYYDDPVPVKEKVVEIPIEKPEKQEKTPDRFLQ